MADEVLKDYPVTDKVTGDKWTIRATSPERAGQIAALRRAAKQGKLKYEDPADEPTLLSFLKESAEAPYKPEAEDLPGFFGSLKRTYSEGLGALGDIMAAPYKATLPENLRKELFPGPKTRPGSSASGYRHVSAHCGDASGVRSGREGCPHVWRFAGWSAAIANAVGLAYPSLAKYNKTAAEKLISRDVAVTGEKSLLPESLRKDPRITVKEAERVTEAQKPTLQSAEELRQRRAELAEAQKAQEAQKELPADMVKRLQRERETLRGAETAEAQAARTAELTEQEAREAVEGLKAYPQVAQQAAEAAKARFAKMPKSEFEFGEEFKGAEFQPKGQPSGYYREAEAIKRAEADELYTAARTAGGDAVIPAEKIVEPLMAELESAGIAREAIPTLAERTGARIGEAVEPEVVGVRAEQKAYEAAQEQLTQQQYDYLKYGKGSTPGTPGTGVPAIPKSIAEAISAAMQKTKSGKFAPTREMEAILEGAKPTPSGVSVNDAMLLHQRLNGEIRAAERAKDFNRSRQLNRYKGIVDTAIRDAKPEALTKLAEADLHYAKEYSPYFDPRSKLYRISQGKAANVVESLVSKDDPRLTEKALSILSDEGKDALRGAWIQKVFEKSLDPLGGAFSPEKLAKEWKSYLPEVREAILGKTGAKEMDDIVEGMGKRARELQDIKASATARKPQAQAAAKAATEARKAAGESEKATFGTVQRELSAQETRRQVTEQATNLEQQAAERLARQTIEFATAEAQRKIPKHINQIMGMSNMQVQAAMGLLDLAEFAGGVGGRRYIIFAARHGIVYMLAKHPEWLGRMAGFGDTALKITNRAINGNPLAPGYTNTARAFWELVQQANVEERRERGNVGDQEGTEDQESR